VLRAKLELDYPGKDGLSKREHLAQVEAATGRKVIVEPEPPFVGVYLWNWFWELNAGRGATGFGPAPLSYEGIAAWARLAGVCLTPWELRAIKTLDATYMAFVAERSSV